jgi:integrase
VRTARAFLQRTGETYCAELSKADVLAVFAVSSKLAATTRHARAMALKRILRYLHEDYGSPRLMHAVPRVTRPLPRAVTATSRERAAILERASPSLKCWLLFCSDLAMRSGTAARICPNNYDEARRELSFTTKYGEHVTLPVTEAVRMAIESAPRDSDAETPYVSLLNRKGGRTSAGVLRRAFRKVARDAGITRHITPHDFRRATAVAVHRLTRDLTIVQALLGHRALQSTLYYLDHHRTPVPLSTLELAKLNPTTETIQ